MENSNNSQEPMDNPIIEVHDLGVSYNKKPVLWDVDFNLPKGKIVGVIGPNGAGKSTLMKAIMGLIPINAGYVKIKGKSLNEVRDFVSYVPQKESVDWDFPASVMDVVLMGRYKRLGLFRKPRKADKLFAETCIEKVGLSKFKDRQISKLSGGQQQRVFIARALAQEAEIYFMDEPFAGVDAATEKSIIEILRDLSKQGKTIMVIHHDLQSAQSFFDWVILLNMRKVAEGPTKETLTNELLQQTYGGKLNVLTEVGRIIEKDNLPHRSE